MNRKLSCKSAIPEQDLPIAIVMGKTGVGKSSLVNHLFGKEVTQTGDVEPATLHVKPFPFEEILYVFDTQGLGETGKAVSIEDQVIHTLSIECPQLLIYCVDGGRRDHLDDEFEALERILSKTFQNTLHDPQLFVVVNKVDNIAPAGSENLPPKWPDFSSLKGENIQQRLGQVKRIVSAKVKSKLLSIIPTSLEWYENSKPWNVDGVKETLLENIDRSGLDLLKRFEFGPADLKLLLSIQNDLIEKDIAESSQESKEPKQRWQKFWQNMILERLPEKLKTAIGTPWGYTDIKLTDDSIKRDAFLLELVLFEPYIKIDKQFESFSVKRNEKLWEKNLKSYLNTLEVRDGSAERIYGDFKKHLSNLAWDWVLIVGVTVISMLIFWWVAPLIGGFIGAMMGYHGVVAVNAGLAWLGFGALAAGGLGMTGGVGILIGIGAFLGATGSTVMMEEYVKSLDNNRALFECAKALTMFESICDMHDYSLVKSFASRFRNGIYKLRSSGVDEEVLKVYKKADAEICNILKKKQVSFQREANNEWL